MTSKRRLECVLPVDSVIGKIAPVDQVVNADNPGFKCFVGFVRSKALNVNRYAIRQRARSTAVSEAEVARRTKFAQVVASTRTRLADPTQRAQDMVAFQKQKRYKTLYQYVFNQEWSKE